MFYDQFVTLCEKKGVAPSRACVEMGLSRSLAAKWKNTRGAPSWEVLQKIAAYFDVSMDELLGGEKRPAEGDITFDDFTYAFHGEAKELSAAEREMLLNMARELARLKREREAKGE